MIVLDCSAAVEIVRETNEGNALRMLMVQGEEVIAPHLFHAEIACAFWKYARAGAYSGPRCVQLIQNAENLIDRYIPLDDFSVEAYAEGMRLRHSPYDMFYFILARRTGSTLVTMDKKLMQLCDEQGIEYVYRAAV